jgi:hypothetical protein
MDPHTAISTLKSAIADAHGGIAARTVRGHAISLLFRCRLLGPPDEARRAESKTPSPGQWRWHHGAPPDLVEAQRQYAEFL